MNLRLRWWRLWAGLVGWNWQQGHPRDAAEALRGPPESKSKRRMEQESPLLHVGLIERKEEVNMLCFEECWAALERRDAGADGKFFYGVRTTGVYCHPGCTSRLPLRKNTMFFQTTAAAAAAGLRPCQRCRPTDSTSASRHVAAAQSAGA